MKRMKFIFIFFLIQFSTFSAQTGFIPEREWICIVNKAPIYPKTYTSAQLKKLKIHPHDNYSLLNIIKPIRHIRSNNNEDFDWLVIIKAGKTFYTPYEYFAPRVPDLAAGQNLPMNVLINRWNNIPFRYKPSDLMRVPHEFISPVQRQYPYYLRKEALKAFSRLLKKAKKEGIHLFIASAWRSPRVQSYLYLQNILAAGPKQIGSAKPTHSEHHLGTTVDLTSKSVNYRLTQDFYKTPEYKWLAKNIKSYNMRITYSKRTHAAEGYMWEPWHVRYMGHN